VGWDAFNVFFSGVHTGTRSTCLPTVAGLAQTKYCDDRTERIDAHVNKKHKKIGDSKRKTQNANRKQSQTET
jgi:hypothetical protein